VLEPLWLGLPQSAWPVALMCVAAVAVRCSRSCRPHRWHSCMRPLSLNSWRLKRPGSNLPTVPRACPQQLWAASTGIHTCAQQLRISGDVVLPVLQGVALIVPWWVQHVVPWAVAFIVGSSAHEQHHRKPH
jgi:hypothetical protein